MFDQKVADQLSDALQKAMEEWAEMSGKISTDNSKEEQDKMQAIAERFAAANKAFNDYVKNNPPLSTKNL